MKLSGSVVVLVLVAGMAGCASLQQWLPLRDPADVRIARTVIIVRDGYGVPSIYGPDDAAVAFGVAWAQAEDSYWQIEEDYIHALGWASYYHGERYLASDLVKAAFDVVRLAREEYEREPAARRAVWDAFAMGLNYHLRLSGTPPRFITRWEPWMVFARMRMISAGSVVDGVRLGEVSGFARDVTGSGASGTPSSGDDGVRAGGGNAREVPAGPAPGGSNMWAVAPARTAGGHALLLQNPHMSFFGGAQPYEMHVHSGSGWHVRGYALLGTPVQHAGHNEHLAWSHTESAADHADVYEVVFDHPDDPLLYRFDGEWRRAVEWEHDILVNTQAGVTRRTYRFRRTHHGPIVAMRDGRALAVRVGRMEEGGSLQQWYSMGRASGFEEFRAALDQRSLMANTLYADIAGNIFHVHGNAVPRRDPAMDWSRPVSGNTSLTDWQGYHELGDLPQLLNPRSGWIQDAGATPFAATVDGENLDAATYAPYLAPDADNARARNSRRLLTSDSAWTFDALSRAAFDTFIIETAQSIAPLVREWEDVGGNNPNRAMRVDDAVDLIRAWDGISTTDSEAMTLFVLWQEQLRSGDYTGELIHFRAMEDVVARLARDFGTARVPWGSINRLQRVHTSGAEPFAADAPSLPVPGAPGWTGVIFAYGTDDGPRGLRFGTHGSTPVSVVELAPDVRSRSVVQFGQSAHPGSPHYFDQAQLYASGEMKAAWFARDDVFTHARRVYHPGFPPHQSH
ncbi:acylase [soil metagenome]